jgi:hypothetical protein
VNKEYLVKQRISIGKPENIWFGEVISYRNSQRIEKYTKEYLVWGKSWGKGWYYE